MSTGLNPDIKSWSSSSGFGLKVNSLSHKILLFHNQMWLVGRTIGGGRRRTTCV